MNLSVDNDRLALSGVHAERGSPTQVDEWRTEQATAGATIRAIAINKNLNTPAFLSTGVMRSLGLIPAIGGRVALDTRIRHSDTLEVEDGRTDINPRFLFWWPLYLARISISDDMSIMQKGGRGAVVVRSSSRCSEVRNRMVHIYSCLIQTPGQRRG